MKNENTLPPAEAAHKSRFHRMTLVEGFRGVSRKLVWEYRGQRIEQVYRTHDVRNKTHNGFAWHVLFSDGTVVQDLTRSQAKDRIDQHAHALESQMKAVIRPSEDRARAAL